MNDTTGSDPAREFERLPGREYRQRPKQPWTSPKHCGVRGFLPNYSGFSLGISTDWGEDCTWVSGLPWYERASYGRECSTSRSNLLQTLNLWAWSPLLRAAANLYGSNSHGVSPIYFVFLKPSTLSSLFPYARDWLNSAHKKLRPCEGVPRSSGMESNAVLANNEQYQLSTPRPSD